LNIKKGWIYALQLTLLATFNLTVNMNKGILNFTYFLILSVLMLAACQKVDNNKIPPVVYLLGENPQMLTLGCKFDTLWVEVVDDKPDSVSVYVSSNVNPDCSGSYFVDYTAVDSDGNSGYATRKVIVGPLKVQEYLGSYKVYDTVKPIGPYPIYQASVSAITANPSQLVITNFNNFGDHFKVPFLPDSIGNFELSYNLNDTIISGSGRTFCDKCGFKVDTFLLVLPNGMNEYHTTNFELN
jgi:hypothetical protein